jgi:hypothetical protein
MKSLIKKILKEETENNDQDYSLLIGRVTKILKLVPVSNYTCTWIFPNRLIEKRLNIFKVVPDHMVNEYLDIKENMKIDKIIRSNINPEIDIMLHSVSYEYNNESCGGFIESTSKLNGYVMVNPNNRK